MDIKKILFSFLFICSVGVALVSAQSSAELKKQREKIDVEIAELMKIVRAKTQEKLLSQKEVNALSRQLNLREDKIKTISSELRIINNNIQKNTKAVNELKAELEKMRKDYEKMILFAFRNKNGYNKLMFIFASKDFNQAFKRVKYLQQFNDARKIKAAEIEATRKEIELKIAQLERDREMQNKLLREQEAEKEIIAKDRSVHAKELSQLQKEESTYKGQLSQKQQEKKRIDAMIQAAIRREIEAQRKLAEEARRKAAEAEAKRTGKTVEEVEKSTPRKSDSEVLRSTPEAAKLSADFKSNRGRLPWPVSQGNVVRNFGFETVERNVRIDNSDVAIRTADNAPVKAVFEGDVVQVIGSFVVIKHGEYFTSYSNLKSVSVRRGQKVGRGQQIGTAGEDPDAGYSIVNFGVFQGQTAMNPVSWLAK
ncbi:peptidoglycan DD-metalloendopeptidase family protein [Sphingobacterium sp. DN00404]|uniref:Peptidoglycan DD-metalloendopeptidase family protein n=1 Tax=Sphingobacterium micropteri TaxID=2763501 RepID=A0ABR7YN89_9SPHI|nr:peptidoglycan DD-metalloendopeptidase family protein [Sphingobacterium micropteri]MBD1432739.1 peptidoglycan DD-metalloendopeptidase family protein [Sphingobacterium micropteri]